MIQSSCFILGFVQRYPTDGGTGLALDATDMKDSSSKPQRMDSSRFRV